MPTPKEINQMFGRIDIYLFDQIVKGRFRPGQSVLDVGCGGGRNLVYFLQNGYDVYGVDQDAFSIESVRNVASALAPQLPAENFRVAEIENLPFKEASFDVVISNAVLHFAAHQEQFEQMLHSMWRVLKPGGILFARLASDIGIEGLPQPTTPGRYRLPDGSERYLVNLEMLQGYAQDLNGEPIEPIKTTNVQNLRCMTTWCVRKTK